MRWVWGAAGILAAIVLLVLLGVAARAIVRPPHVVAVGIPIRHDDFLFTVTGIHRQELTDGVTLYRADVRVTSQAVVVDYHWRDDIAYVRAFDQRGFGHNFSSSMHASFVLAPGQARDAHLEFRIPRDMSSPALHFWDGIFMGDALNGGAYVKTIVPLGDYHPPSGT